MVYGSRPSVSMSSHCRNLAGVSCLGITDDSVLVRVCTNHMKVTNEVFFFSSCQHCVFTLKEAQEGFFMEKQQKGSEFNRSSLASETSGKIVTVEYI